MHDLIKSTHPEWHSILEQALSHIDYAYLKGLKQHNDWLPGWERLFAVFNCPLSKIRYILLGESPYPRPQSANGYAFWDNAVHSLWSAKGLSKEVNRATSLRNFIKMLLIARGDLSCTNKITQQDIANLDKINYWQTADQLFLAMIRKGFLLLNATLVFNHPVQLHAKQWRPFMENFFEQLAVKDSSLELILFGRFAAQIPATHLFNCLIAEHPYNLSFITNPDVLTFFKPLDLMTAHE